MTSSYKDFPCDLCGSNKAVEAPYVKLYNNNQPIHICVECGFVYVKSRRPAAQIADAWSNELYGKAYTARIPAVKARQVYVADFIDVKLGLREKSLLDIGSGEGQFLKIAQDDYGAKVFGIEPSFENCQKVIDMGLESFQGTLEDYILTNNRKVVDIVTIMWTLENCSSCRNMLKGAYEILKPGGHIVVATGSRILVPFKKPISMYFGDNSADTHCFRFSANTLEGILAVSGFEKVHINRYIDTDYLCIIAEKKPKECSLKPKNDNYLKVYNFFERWHHDSMFYLDYHNNK